MKRVPRVWMSRMRCAQVLLVAALLTFTQSSDAAVRLCEAPVSSGPVKAATEKEARAAALAAWKAKTLAQHGERYAGWRIAVSKILKCLPDKQGGVDCLARATPCTVEQAPARRELRQKRLGI